MVGIIFRVDSKMTSKNRHLTLKERPDLALDTLNLIHKSFAYSKSNRFDIDFYPLFNEENFQNIHILVNENNLVVASIGFLEKKLKFKNRSVTVGFLGGIAVDEKSRGQGVFKDFFSEILKIYENQVALLFLWSNLYEMYNKFDFHLAGEFYEYQPLEAVETMKSKKLSELSQSDWDLIKKIYNENHNRYLAVERTANDWNKIKKVSSVNGYIHNDNYYFFNKGEDLMNVVHEFGGGDLSELAKITYSVWSPTKLQLKNESKKTLALVKVADAKLFLAFLDTFFEGKIKVNTLTAKEIKFQFNQQVFVESISNFLTLLFGPNPAQEFQMYLPSLFIGGVDSI